MKTRSILRKDTKMKPDRRGRRTALEIVQELSMSAKELANVLQIPERTATRILQFDKLLTKEQCKKVERYLDEIRRR
jgi:plasmid maintenance system antidote protein VapI|nr:MAG TPA: LAC REPRESSOR HP62/DNA COMPLEX REGULATION, LAC OPERON, LAC [Caudoviricetes sp.]